jgi:hypothetical protein
MLYLPSGEKSRKLNLQFIKGYSSVKNRSNITKLKFHFNIFIPCRQTDRQTNRQIDGTLIVSFTRGLIKSNLIYSIHRDLVAQMFVYFNSTTVIVKMKGKQCSLFYNTCTGYWKIDAHHYIHHEYICRADT